MKLLRAAASRSHEIVRTISEIAEHTSLVALGTSIDAARSGEHGMVAAAVADEVRRLADRSHHAANKIAALVEPSRHGGQAEDASSDEAARMLNEIITGVEAAARKIAKLTEANVKQTSGAKGPAALEPPPAGEPAMACDEVAACGEQLAAQASVLRDMVKRIKTLSAETFGS
jgi:methyl-accepting chemotaxis protein